MLEEISAEALELTLPDGSPAVGKTLKELDLPSGVVIGLLEREEDMLIPTGTTKLLSGDKIVIFASTDTMPAAIKVFGEALQ